MLETFCLIVVAIGSLLSAAACFLLLRMPAKNQQEQRNLKELATWLELQACRDAIRKHRDAKGHDRCWLNDRELYRVLGDPIPEPELPPMDEFLRKCEEYWGTQHFCVGSKPANADGDHTGFQVMYPIGKE